MEAIFEEFNRFIQDPTFAEIIDLTAIVFAVFGGMFALFVFWITANRFLKQSRASHYSALDDMYAELLRIGIEKPYLRTPEEIENFVNYIAESRKREGASKEEQSAHVGSEEAIGEIVGVKELVDLKLAQAGPDAIEPVPPKPEATAEELSKRDRATEYGIYAFMIFNFLETIHDRCDDTAKWPRNRPDKTLRGTWEGILIEEYKLHARWFKIETNDFCEDTSKFCVGFVDFILNDRIGKKSWKYRSIYRLFLRRGRADVDEIKWKDGYSPFDNLKPLERLYEQTVARLPF